MARSLLAVIAGAVVMWLTVSALQFAGHVLFPPPPGLDPKDPAQLQRLIAQMPFGALPMLLAAWLAGTFAGACTAARLSRRHRRAAAVAVALLVMLGVCGMIVLAPDRPIWVSALGLLLPIPASLLAARVATPASASA